MPYKTEEFPEGTQLIKPDGSAYIFVKVVEPLEKSVYVDLNQLGHAMNFKGMGARFPQALTTEIVPHNWYTFVMVRPPQPRQPNEPKVLLTNTK